MCHGESLSCRLSNTEQSSVSGAVSGSLLSGAREPDRIVSIVSFEVTTPFQRPRYSYVLKMEGNKKRVESGGRAAASKTMGARLGYGIKSGHRVRLPSKKDQKS